MNSFFLAISWDWSNINGFSITAGIVGILIVFGSLVLLSYIYRLLPRILTFNLRSRLLREGKIKASDSSDLSIPGEVNAAISIALHLFLDETHDKESQTLTIKKVPYRYSPWNMKSAIMNTYFDKRK